MEEINKDVKELRILFDNFYKGLAAIVPPNLLPPDNVLDEALKQIYLHQGTYSRMYVRPRTMEKTIYRVEFELESIAYQDYPRLWLPDQISCGYLTNEGDIYVRYGGENIIFERV